MEVTEVCFVASISLFAIGCWYLRHSRKSRKFADPESNEIVTNPLQEDLQSNIGFQNGIGKLDNLSMHLQICRLQDGWLQFGTETEKAEIALFKQVESTIQDIEIKERGKDREVKRFFKKTLMRSNFDPRGSRRLKSVLEMFKLVKDGNGYKPSFLNQFKPRTCCPQNCVGSKHFGLFFTAVKCSLIPMATVLLDMGTDGNMLVVLGNYILQVQSIFNQTSTNNIDGEDLFGDYDHVFMTMGGMWGILLIVFILSLGSLMLSSNVRSLWNNFDFICEMSDLALERDTAPISLRSLCRHNMVLDEASSESTFQCSVQWAIYLALQMAIAMSVKNLGIAPEQLDNANFSFDSLYISGILSVLSLTMAQYKANALLTEYSTTLLQKLIYLSACFCNTVSSQLIITTFLLTLFDFGLLTVVLVGGYGGMSLGIVILISLCFAGLFIPLYIRNLVLGQWLYKCPTGLSNKGKYKINKKVNTALLNTGILMEEAKTSILAMWSMQALQLYTSKTRILTFRHTFYPGLMRQDLLIADNFTCNLTLPIICIVQFFLTYGLLFILPASERVSPFSPAESPARSNFLITASSLVPLGWLAAQLLVQFFFYLDLGALTCGAVFHYDRKLDDLEQVTSTETTSQSKENKPSPTTEFTGNESTDSDKDDKESIDGLSIDRQEGSTKGSSRARLPCLSYPDIQAWFFKRIDPEFVFDAGRWVDDDNFPTL